MELPQDPQASASGLTALPRGLDKLLWVDLEIRVQLCATPPPPDVFCLGEGCCPENTLSPALKISLKLSPPWVVCHIPPNPRPIVSTQSPDSPYHPTPRYQRWEKNVITVIMQLWDLGQVTP